MRLPLLLLLLALAAGAAAGLLLHDEAGYVLVSLGPWILETSVLGFVATVVVSLLIVYYGGRLLIALLRLPVTVRRVLATRRERRAQRSLESGLQRLLEGQWAQAEVDFVRRAADHHAPDLNYLLAARAAHRVGARDRRDHYLALAEQQGESAAFAAQLLRAELVGAEDPATALPLLENLRLRQPKHSYVIELLAELYDRTGAWDALRRLLCGGEAARALPAERHRRWLARALREELRAAAETARLDALKSVWDSTPAAFRVLPEVREPYLRGLARFGADAQAAALIVQTMQGGWDARLAVLYGELEGLDPVAQLATVEQWLNLHGERAELLLAAGRVCTRNRLWGKARSYLDAALRLAPTAEVYLALARLCEQAKQPDEASLFYRRGLELAAGVPAAQPSAGQVSKA